jgi:hypothetical protein
VGVWRSLDGLAWELEPEVPAFQGEAGTFEPMALDAIRGRIVVGGTYPRPERAGGGWSGATWITPTSGIDTPPEATACPKRATLESIANTVPSRRPRCFGRQPITISGYVGQLGDLCDICRPTFFALSPGVGPFYLNFEVYPGSAHDADPSRWARLAGHRLRVTGRFNDPTASGCRRDDVAEGLDPVATLQNPFRQLEGDRSALTPAKARNAGTARTASAGGEKTYVPAAER